MSVPRLTLASDVMVVGNHLSRGQTRAPVTDAMLLIALAAGLAPDQVPEASRPIQTLHSAGMLVWRLDGLAEAAVLAQGVPLAIPRARPGRVELSRFALLRSEESAWVLESGLSPWCLRLSEAGVKVLAAQQDPEGWLAGLLAAAGMLPDDDQAAAHWSVHDRYFLSRSRGDLTHPAPPREQGVVPEEPLPQEVPLAVPLPVPAGPAVDEPTLFEVSEARRTVREFSDRPVGLEQLGALLWRTMRVVRFREKDPEDPMSYDVVMRPVPSGGAMHSSDLWLFCRDVEAVVPGVYRYDPVRHGLVAGNAVESIDVPLAAPVVGVITVRHKRTAWKYGPIALSLELKDLGVQMMALQLAAGPLGLGMCPLGSGPTQPLAQFLGLDPLVDAPIGEFTLGAL